MAPHSRPRGGTKSNGRARSATYNTINKPPHKLFVQTAGFVRPRLDKKTAAYRATPRAEPNLLFGVGINRINVLKAGVLPEISAPLRLTSSQSCQSSDKDTTEKKLGPGITNVQFPATSRGKRAHQLCVDPSDERPSLTKRVCLSDTPKARNEQMQETTLQLLTELRQRPRALDLAQIGAGFSTLQALFQNFSRKYFGPTRSDGRIEGVRPIQLHEMPTKYPALYCLMLNLLDASLPGRNGVSGWTRFLNDGEYRQYFVCAILGEWMTQRIFKHTAFGLKPTETAIFAESIDQDLINCDSFSRTRERAGLMRSVLNCCNTSDHSNHIQNLRNASFSLCKELLELLRPLLPDTIGGLGGKKTQFQDGLLELVEYCGALHQSIILTGKNGTIVRIVPRIENGREFSEMAPFHAVNPEQLEFDGFDVAQEHKAITKMTCWARVEAYVPHQEGLEADEATAPRESDRITFYPELCRHAVFVEYTPKSALLSDGFDDPIGTEARRSRLDYKARNSLPSMIIQARNAQRSFVLGYEDFRTDLWNLYAQNNLSVEWGAFLVSILACAGYSIYRAPVFSLEPGAYSSLVTNMITQVYEVLMDVAGRSSYHLRHTGVEQLNALLEMAKSKRRIDN